MLNEYIFFINVYGVVIKMDRFWILKRFNKLKYILVVVCSNI